MDKKQNKKTSLSVEKKVGKLRIWGKSSHFPVKYKRVHIIIIILVQSKTVGVKSSPST